MNLLLYGKTRQKICLPYEHSALYCLIAILYYICEGQDESVKLETRKEPHAKSSMVDEGEE